MNESLYGKGVVLYADDDPDDLEMLRNAFLPYTSLELRTFIDGLDLLSYVDRMIGVNMIPILILLDINMPMLSAWQVLKKLRATEATREVHVLFLTNFTVRRGEDSGIYDGISIITKPSRPSELDRMMKTIISHCPRDMHELFRM